MYFRLLDPSVRNFFQDFVILSKNLKGLCLLFPVRICWLLKLGSSFLFVVSHLVVKSTGNVLFVISTQSTESF